MLGADEVEELRSLQARAYGRDTVLTEAEALKLRDLEDRRLVLAAESSKPVVVLPERTGLDRTGLDRTGPDRTGTDQTGTDRTGPGRTAHEQTGPGRQVGDAEAATDAVDASTPAPESLRSLLRAHWRPFAIAAATVLIIGLGVGWLAFGSAGSAPVELTAEQQNWQEDLVSEGNYDAGSIHALAVEEGAVIWVATRDERKNTCLILSTGAVTTPSCDRTERIAETGIYGAITVKGAGDAQRQVSAQMLLTASGEPAVAVSSYDYEPTEIGMTYANEAELQTAERLADEGFEPGSLWVVGYDGDVPIWSGMKLDSQNQCLIYDGSESDAPIICADPETMQDQASSLVLNVTDADTGEVTHLELASRQSPGYLVITREGSVFGAGED